MKYQLEIIVKDSDSPFWLKLMEGLINNYEKLKTISHDEDPLWSDGEEEYLLYQFSLTLNQAFFVAKHLLKHLNPEAEEYKKVNALMDMDKVSEQFKYEFFLDLKETLSALILDLPPKQ